MNHPLNLHTQPLVSFWKHHPVADQKAETLADETITFYEKFECDFIKLTPAGCWQAACYGIQHAWEPNPIGIRTIKKTIIHEPADWLSLPDFSKNSLPAMMEEMTNACRRVNEHFSFKVPVFCTIFCPISQAIQLAGIDVFLSHIQESPQNVLAGLQQITNNTLLTIQAFRSAGANGVYFVSQHMRDELLPKQVYEQFGTNFDAQCLYACKDLPLNIFHIHGNTIYFCFAKLPENCTIHFESSPINPQAQEYSSAYSHNVSIGIRPDIMLRTTSEEEISRLANKYIFQNQTQNILTAGCVLPLDFPDEVLLKWLNAIKAIKRKQ